MNNRYKVATIGLGSMGLGIASSLLKADLDVYGYDMSEAREAEFLEAGGLPGELSDVASILDAVVVVVLNAAQAELVLFGENGVVANLRKGSVVVLCATVTPDFAGLMAECCSEMDVHYLDAPISGGSIKAAAGQLSVMASGNAKAFAAAKPVLDAMAENVFEMGGSAGAGSAMKAVNQLLAGVHIASMAEALAFGIKQGIDPEKLVSVITQSAGNSWMFENRAPHVVSGDYTPHSAVDIWLKDLGIVLEVSKQEKFSAPLTAAALQQFVAASGSGYGAEDDAAVIKVYASNANIELPRKA